MAEAGILMGWVGAKPGRKGLAGEPFGTTTNDLTNKVTAGAIESFEPVFLSRCGGRMNGFVLIRDEAEDTPRPFFLLAADHHRLAP